MHLLMVVASLPNLCRRSMASLAAGTRYAVQLLAPPEGPVLGVAACDDKASVRCGYEVLQEPAGGSFDGLQVCALTENRVSLPHGDRFRRRGCRIWQQCIRFFVERCTVVQVRSNAALCPPLPMIICVFFFIHSCFVSLNTSAQKVTGKADILP